MISGNFARVLHTCLSLAARMDGVGMIALRGGLFLVLVWIGALKFSDYEAEGIVPFVANSPAGRWLYHRPPGEYRAYMNQEGELPQEMAP